jgi:hypothetical protein
VEGEIYPRGRSGEPRPAEPPAGAGAGAGPGEKGGFGITLRGGNAFKAYQLFFGAVLVVFQFKVVPVLVRLVEILPFLG